MLGWGQTNLEGQIMNDNMPNQGHWWKMTNLAIKRRDVRQLDHVEKIIEETTMVRIHPEVDHVTDAVWRHKQAAVPEALTEFILRRTRMYTWRSPAGNCRKPQKCSPCKFVQRLSFLQS